MNINKKKMDKQEMQTINAGTEKNTTGTKPGSKCAFAGNSCCKRTENCTPENTKG